MKRSIFVLLCAALTLSLTACGDDESSVEESTSGGIEIVATPDDDDLEWGDFEIVE